MKRTLLACCLIIASCTMTMAQSTATQIDSKPAFTTKVSQLNSLLTQNNTAQAQTVFTNLKHTMEQKLGETKTQILNATSDADKNSLMLKIRKQQTDYAHIVAAVNENMVTNRAQINTDFQDFINNY